MSYTYVSAELRRLVPLRAGERCEYCLMPESAVFAVHEIDHIVAEKHGGETVADNLAWACALCNQFKASDLASIDPESGDMVRLFHPRRDVWSDHFQLAEGRIVPLTAVGRVTARLLQFNHPDRVAERKLLMAARLIQAVEAG